jgi:hypothetical protein
MYVIGVIPITAQDALLIDHILLNGDEIGPLGKLEVGSMI